MGTKHAEHHYNIPRLNVIFAWSSLALLVSIVGLIWWDYKRPWKDYQREFAALDLQKTEKDVAAAIPDDKKQELDDLEKQLQAAKTEFAQRGADPAYAADVELVQSLSARQYILDERAKQIKSVIDSRRFYFEEDLNKAGREAAAPLKKELDDLNAQRNETLDDMKTVEEQLTRANAKLAVWTKKQDEAQARITEITKKRDLLVKKQKGLEPDWINKTRNAVILDMLQPTLKPKQIETTKIQDDWIFEKANKVDRCTSCHLAIDKEGYEDWPQPYRTHPNLALYLTAKSPHKMDDVGCTICHQGRGWAMDFNRVTHSPGSDAQEEEWQKKYGWQHDHWWEQLMFPKRYSEAGCYVCHQEQLQIGDFPPRDPKGVVPEGSQPAAPTLDQGLKTVYNYGCYACHKIQPMLDPEGTDPGMRDFRKNGPDLRHVSMKLDERFINKWLQNPKHFRPTTRMPRIFGLENHDTPDLRMREQVEINSAAYLVLSGSQPLDMDRPSGPGDAEKGRSMIVSIGCLACHSIATVPTLSGKEAAKAVFAPDLSAIGSKTTYEWIYGWIRNPKHYWEDTKMGNLRLTEEEARDLASFLSTLRNEAFDKEEPIGYDPKVLDQVTREYLLTTLTVEEADRKIGEMSTEEKELLVGQKIINRYGCHGCHLIAGYEKAMQIGTELTEEGSKDVERLDFAFLRDAKVYGEWQANFEARLNDGREIRPLGFAKERAALQPTDYDFFTQKLKAPRSYDFGKEKTAEELLKMPQFDFTDEQIQAISTFILSLRKKDTIPFTSQKHLSGREKALEKGHRILMKYNCQGCHFIDGKGGEAIQAYLPQDIAPPPVDGAGKKLQMPWLFGFLKEPSTLRVISVRMPTFGFSDAEANALIEYLAAIWSEPYPFDSIKPPVLTEEDVPIAKQLFEKAKCQSCHVTSATPSATDKEKVAPNLSLARVRLKPKWATEWLAFPQSLQPNTKMPSFYGEGDYEPNPSLAGFYKGEDTEEAIKAQAKKQIDIFNAYTWALKDEEPPKPQQ